MTPGLKRFVIFTALFSPLSLAVYFVTDLLAARDFLSSFGLLLFLLGYTYLFTLIPAWLTAGMDWALSAKPLYLRLVATMPVAAVMGVLVASASEIWI